ncbi:Uu.00g118440.m01.CDS01 [Anthostomella pinea]|uniref:Uu.00g118440.m01.CDS01 n=1 Tax=Anthostomella pinea TaxID=933095 RepID=A0AAI8VHD2_9PEZI|nr:Uu.00g118440.m01.CDS01 [Anthostomella pinea]
MGSANYRVAQVKLVALARCSLQTFDLYTKLDIAPPFNVTAEIEIAGGSVSNTLFLYFDNDHRVGRWDKRVHDCESIPVDDTLRAIQVASAVFRNGIHTNARPTVLVKLLLAVKKQIKGLDTIIALAAARRLDQAGWATRVKCCLAGLERRTW